MTREKKIGLAIAAVAALGGWGLWKKESPPIVINNSNVVTIPGLPGSAPSKESTGDRRRGGERIDFQGGTVEVSDPDIENRVARIAAAVKSMPVGAQAEIVADIGEREDASELLATERTKLVKNLLVTAGVPNDRLRVLIQNDRTTPTYTLHAVNVRWSYPEPQTP